jgi:CBS domain containing-hemolysin-like protein
MVVIVAMLVSRPNCLWHPCSISSRQILLVLLNAFFVGAEFALVRSRRTRLKAMTRTGGRLARIALRLLKYLSRSLRQQLGVALASPNSAGSPSRRLAFS